MSVHTLDIWNSLRRELIEGTDEEIGNETLETLTSLIKNLEKGPITPKIKTALDKLASSIMSSE